MSEARTLQAVGSDGTVGVVTVAEGLPADALTWVFVPAMGVRAAWYRPLSRALAARGVRLAVVEWRGHGESPVRPCRGVNWGYRELVEVDLVAAVRAVQAAFPMAPRVLGGHSLGGQLTALLLAAQPELAEALVTVAACSVWWRAFPGATSARVLAGTQAASALAAGLGWFPGPRVGFAGHEARGVVADWAAQARTGRYRVRGTEVDYHAGLAVASRPALLLSLVGDERLAPRSAVAHLAGLLPSGSTEHVYVDHPRVRALRRPHVEWAAEPGPVLDVALRWLHRHASIAL
ncbi:MAG: putative alpha/beta hydrolase [Myxococcota bacterium]